MQLKPHFSWMDEKFLVVRGVEFFRYLARPASCQQENIEMQ